MMTINKIVIVSMFAMIILNDGSALRSSSAMIDSPLGSSASSSPPSTSFSETNDYATKLLQFYSEDPSSEDERRCLSLIEDGISIDVIIDISNSPSSDDYDQLSAQVPPSTTTSSNNDNDNDDSTISIGGAGSDAGDAAQVYFDSIALFLDLLQADIEPSRLYSVLIDKGQKYYISGRKLNRTRQVNNNNSRRKASGGKNYHHHQQQQHFYSSSSSASLSEPCPPPPPPSPSSANIESSSSSSRPDDIQMTSLGTLTKLALQARDQGLPIVLRNSKPSITLYSILVTDGASGLPALFFSQDRSKTTIVDIGKRRFLSRMSYNSFIQYANVITLQHPQQLVDIVSTIRFIACKIVGAASGAKK